MMAISEKRIKADVGSAVYEFTNVGAALVSARLKNYLGDGKKGQIDLVAGANRSISPLYFFGNGKSARLNQASYLVEGGNIELTPSKPEGKIRFIYQDGSGLSAEKTFSFRYNSYVIRAEVKINGIDKGKKIGLGWGPRLGGGSGNTYGGVIEGPMSLVGKDLEYDVPEKGKPVVHGNQIKWTSLQSKYFIAAFVPRSGASGAEIRLLGGKNEKKDYAVVVPLYGAPQVNAVFDIFIGPKETDLLSALNVKLEDALDYGMFSFIARPLMFILRICYSLTGNWGVAIILLTVLIKILFYPLTQVSMRNMRNMQKLQPKMAQLREIYKENKEKMNQEVMALYKEHKVNPMMGCLPMVIQIPVFFGLYQALLVSIELRQAPFFGWIQDLSTQDPFHVFTILMGASMFLQQKMTPTTGDPAQAKMMMFMPVIFTGMFIYYPVPVGLVIYWFMNNLLSIIQQYFVNRSVSPPKLAEDS
jgi:YidC/Oxa1 family membrane protein insertase